MPGESKTFTYVIDADTDGFKKDVDDAAEALAQLQKEADAAKPPLTDLQKAKKALAAATKALTAQQKKEAAAAKVVTDQLKKETAAERALVRETKKATAASKAAASADNKRAGELKQGLNAVLGDQVNKVTDVAAAFGTAGLAIVGSAAAGVAAVAAFAAITTVTLQGVIALGQGVIDLTREMDGYSEEVSDANDAMDAAVAISSVLKGELATELAPEVEHVARLIGALGLAAVESFETVADNSNVALEAVSRLSSLGIRPSTELMLLSVEAVTALARARGADVEAIDEWIASTRLANSGLGNLIESAGHLEDSLADELVQVDLIIESQKEAAATSKAQAEAEAELAAKRKSHARDVAREQEKAAQEAVKAAADAAKKQAEIFKQQIAAEDELRAIASERVQSQLSDAEKLEQARDDELNQINQLAFLAGGTVESERIAAEARLAVLEEFSQARFNLAIEDGAALQAVRDEENAAVLAADKVLADERIAQAGRVRDALISAGAEVAAALIEGVNSQREQAISSAEARIDADIAALEMKEALNEKEAAALAKLNEQKQTLGLVDFRRGKKLSTAQILLAGATLAITSSLPPPAGIGFPQGLVAAGITTGAQLAIVAGTTAPSFHQGLSQEFQATLQRGEEVATAQAARNNPGVVGAMNRGAEVGGGNSSGGQIFQVLIDNEDSERSTVKQLQGDGPLPVLVRDRSPGMSRVYGRR